VPGCRNLTSLPKPNQLADGSDPADPLYSTLSHELFETITDPRGTAWRNPLLGNEIADQCSWLENFVTVNGHRYILQSEYSDIHHMCSANLTTDDLTLTPQPH
jgi:hypothetical protein